MANTLGPHQQISTDQASEALQCFHAVQHQLHHLTSLIIPEISKELTQTRAWQNHCFDLYEEASIRVRQAEEKMAGIKQQYEAKLASAASLREELDELLMLDTSNSRSAQRRS